MLETLIRGELSQIVYRSEAVTPFTEDRLARLLSAARDYNSRIGVTGVLLHHHGSFVQCLEGSPDALEQVWSRICADPGHHQIVKLHDTCASARSFEAWSMGCMELGLSEWNALEAAMWHESASKQLGSALVTLKLTWDRINVPVVNADVPSQV